MGGKSSSGGGGRTPHEAPDSLISAQRLRAIGLISLGPIKGPVNKWKSTYFDNTPIQNANGKDDNDADSFNFKNTEIQFNLGTQDQLPLKGFEASEREVSVGAEVKQAHPLTRSVIDPDVTRIRLTLGVNALYAQNDQGDTNGTSVEFQVLINGNWRATYEINGKSSSRFFRSYIIDDLPARPFDITIKRVTADSKSQRLQNTTNWVSYTEIIDTKLSYPNMAVVGVKTDSRYNPNFPNINFLLYGRIIKVPTTYDPEKRTYAARIWKGDWKLAWTNNPAWVFYDLITDKLAGLGQRISDYGLDKFALYQIAKYCDEQVEDGYGGEEPRMTANLWITDQRDAYQVISDMASVFRAIAVWNGTQFTAIQDRTSDPVCLYNQSNVIDGKFSRQYAAQKAIYTAVEVEYADARNLYQKAIEYVADDAMIARYGYNVKKITAFACTSRGQAHRYGKWVLETSRLEQCTITFSVGRQGLMHLPGDIIEIADNEFAGKTLGGRVVAVSGKTVTLDQAVEISGDSYLSYLNDEMKVIKIKIASVDSKNKAVVTLVSEPTGLDATDDWILKTPTVSTQLYRAIGITENDDGSYTITALQHEPQKEAIVDGSASFVPVTTTVHTGGLSPVQHADVSADGSGILLTFTSPSFIGQGLKYQVKLYRDGKLYEIYDDLPEPRLAFNDLPDGSYVAEIRAKNSAGQLSEPKTVTFTVSFTITEFVTVPKIFAIELKWKNPLYANSKSSIEIWVSNDSDFNHARRLVTLAYPTNSYTYSGLSVGDRFWFWARMTDGVNAGKFTAAVEGAPSSDPTQLTEYLHGQITKTELGKELIDSLQSTDDALDDEINNRKSAIANALAQITAESQERVKALQDEASTRGTAISELKNVDKQQAQQITTLTAKADNALSGITAEQKARADGDKANADKINAITARVGSAEGAITNLQSTKASKNEVTSIAQQTIQAKFDALSIGGRNLFLGTATGLSGSGANSYLNKTYSRSQNVDVSAISAITISCDVQLSNIVGDDKETRIGCNTSIEYEDGTSEWLEAWYPSNMRVSSSQKVSFSGRISKTKVITKKIKSTWSNFKVQVKGVTAGTWSVKNAKLEIGTIATDWTPAPEDTNDSIATVSAKINSVQTTLANADTALGKRIDTVSASVNDAKAQISTVSKAVADTNGKLSATHTIKTQAISGGRTAIAGIALGATADNKTKESSVIVMADKFGVVKNASDGNVVSMLSVVNNKVAINGDLIADGIILGKHIKANQTLNSPVINGGSVNIGNDNFTVSSDGTVTAKKGKFSGSLEAATGSFKGNITGATGTFTGNIYAKNLVDDAVLAYSLPSKIPIEK